MEWCECEKWLRFRVVILVVMFLLGCKGCLEEEKEALLQLKPFFYTLYNWVDEENYSDCCKWESVGCDSTTGRVTTLSLDFESTSMYVPYDRIREPWYLNASLFLPFEDLKTLSLRGNRIAGCLHNHGFGELARKLNKLEVLDLGLNHFNDSKILTSSLEFSSLKSLNLSYNNFVGPIHTNGKGFKELSRLSNLETLYLRGNYMFEINSLLHLIGDLSSLKTLDLEYCGLKGTIQIQEIFSNLINLKELYLVGNEIESFGSFQDDGRQSGLIGLEVLSLTLNLLNGSILSSLGPFSKSLKLVHIEDFHVRGSINIEGARERGLKSMKGVDLVQVQAANNSILPQSLGLFPSLRTLRFESYIDDDQIVLHVQELRNLTDVEEFFWDESSLPTNFLEYVGNLTSLRVLTLSGNVNLSIQGPLHLKNLKILSFSGCELTGTLSALGICELTSLEDLHLSLNNLTGTLPDCFSNLTFLRHLDLSSNQFSGNLSMSSLTSLTSMESIDLSNNQFQIPSTLKPFFNHSKLKHFNGDYNHIFAETTEQDSFAPGFQLNFISLSCCGNGVTLPKFFQHQHELQYVDLSNINLTGELPSWLLENNIKLETLSLANNSLSGHLKFPSHSPRKLSKLDISKNFFDGYIPTEIGKYLPCLTFLNISTNSLDGGIPSSMGNMKFLRVLDLSNNRLSGIIPESLAISCSFLLDLILSNNSLQGQIFSSNFNLVQLRRLELDGNNFTGVIPKSLANSTSSLEVIDISSNHISGGIPQWLGYMSALDVIVMSNNHIEGPIPMEFCKLGSRVVLDLSVNNISGTIPSCFSPLFLTAVDMSNNRLSGPIPNSLCNSWSLIALDLSDNQLSGNIPNCFGNLSELSFLVLKHNNFEGQIPKQLCQLNKLGLIDLSQNNLSGVIPQCLNFTTYKDTYDRDRLPYSLSYYDRYIRGRTWYSPDYGSIELTTKSMSYSYKGRRLVYLYAIDLSCNKLTGEIPHQMGNFYMIQVLNLSRNSLIGPIPASLSNIAQMESLDLSYNNLSGGIPPQFVQLHFLAYFNVSYNNLSGKPPPRVGQFAADIDENSYWGNPFFNSTSNSTSNSAQHHEEDVGGFIDIESFYVTFGVVYMMALLGIAAVLYINPYWRGAWFYFVDRVITTCIYFVIDNVLPQRFRFCYI